VSESEGLLGGGSGSGGGGRLEAPRAGTAWTSGPNGRAAGGGSLGLRRRASAETVVLAG
jgi:hypothetical protein